MTMLLAFCFGAVAGYYYGLFSPLLRRYLRRSRFKPALLKPYEPMVKKDE